MSPALNNDTFDSRWWHLSKVVENLQFSLVLVETGDPSRPWAIDTIRDAFKELEGILIRWPHGSHPDLINRIPIIKKEIGSLELGRVLDYPGLVGAALSGALESVLYHLDELARELLKEQPPPIDRRGEPKVPVVESNEAELSNIETKRVRGTFYRFHSKTHFHSSEDEFYKNFLETSRTFSQQARFAPNDAHSGFYFGSSKNIAIAEMAHYNKLSFSKKLDEVAPEEFLHELGKRNLHKVFLSVELDIDGIVDFTEGKVVERFLRNGRIGYRKRRPEYWVQYVKPLVAKKQGGNDFTDALGVDVKSLEYDGVLFPSVRALQHDADVPFGIRLGEHHAQAGGLGSDSNIMELHWQLQEQFKREYNLVVFSGSRLTRSISSYSWVDANKNFRTQQNRYYGISKDELQEIRIEERERLGLDYLSAIKFGLLTDDEITNEFENQFYYTRT